MAKVPFAAWTRRNGREAHRPAQLADLLLLRPGCKKVFEAEPEKYLDPRYEPSM